jgi:glucose/arabinose dehydrogenase
MLWRMSRGPALLVALLLVVGCSGGAASHSAPRSQRPSPTPSPLACASAQSSSPAVGLSSTLPLLTLASGLPGPDDMLQDGDLLLVGEYGSGRILELGAEGGPHLLAGSVPEVEGIARLGGILYVADQLDDRVVKLAPDGTVTPVLQLQPVAGVEGVDQIATDATQLLVPDSPRGRLLFVSPQGTIQRNVGGFDRPTGAWPMPDGSVLVADENAGRVYSVSPGGAVTVLASRIGLVDDVAAGYGHTYAIGISAGVLVELTGNGVHDVVSGLEEPQGLVLDPAGNPVVTEERRGTVVVAVTSFRLLPAGPTPRLQAHQPLCVRLVRGPGFTGAVTIQPGVGYRVVSNPGAGSLGEISPAGCAGTCSILVRARSGGLESSVWLSFSGIP